MSQQEMQFESSQQNESKMYDSGYEAFSHENHDYAFPPFNQKIAGREEQNARESDHLREHRLNLRIGMAITSLVFWMIFFFGCIFLVLKNPTVSAVPQLTVLGLGIFTALIILANILINRKKI